jgi:hypothetical protein
MSRTPAACSAKRVRSIRQAVASADQREHADLIRVKSGSLDQLRRQRIVRGRELHRCVVIEERPPGRAWLRCSQTLLLQIRCAAGFAPPRCMGCRRGAGMERHIPRERWRLLHQIVRMLELPMTVLP